MNWFHYNPFRHTKSWLYKQTDLSKIISLDSQNVIKITWSIAIIMVWWQIQLSKKIFYSKVALPKPKKCERFVLGVPWTKADYHLKLQRSLGKTYTRAKGKTRFSIAACYQTRAIQTRTKNDHSYTAMNLWGLQHIYQKAQVTQAKWNLRKGANFWCSYHKLSRGVSRSVLTVGFWKQASHW